VSTPIKHRRRRSISFDMDSSRSAPAPVRVVCAALAVAALAIALDASALLAPIEARVRDAWERRDRPRSIPTPHRMTTPMNRCRGGSL